MESKVIVITGSSHGIGAELVRGFARKGDRVVVNYLRSDEDADRLWKELSTGGGDAVLSVKADVTRRGEVRDMFQRIMEKFGRVDVLVNNAGLNLDSPFIKMTDAQWQSVLEVNLTGTFICSQEFVFHFRASRGHIINIGATTVFKGRKNGVNYCSAKAGVVAMTKCLAQELAPRILVNCVIPGWIETGELIIRYQLDDPENLNKVLETIPMQRLGTPADIFKTIDFIVSDADYITGQNFFVNGGFHMY